MKIPSQQRIEREFFRMLNRVVEPAVRFGIGSPRFVPGGLIVLESEGFKTGNKRRTPLVAIRLQKYVFISTARGDRSFWVKNLNKQPRVRYWLGGRERQAKAFVMLPGKRYRRPRSLPTPIGRIADVLAPYTKAGWAFAVLAPAD
jgi:hypothetical protein